MDGTVAANENAPVRLPVLRDDLEIEKTAPLTNGAPAWVIFDPPANRYYEIGRELLDMLTLWRVGDIDRLVLAVRHEYGRVISREDVEAAAHFLISNALVRDIPNNDFATMAAKAKEGEKSWWSTAMHSYLFFRIPLFRPDRFLRRTWPGVAFLFTLPAVLTFALMGLMGIYLVSRQWEQFSGTFQYMLSWEGALYYGLSLVVVKSLHELGHAFMAVRYGLRVPTIGIAFMVLMPVLYTDTSGAWRLKRRGQRLMIDSAGIFTELALACIATFLWAFLPDGSLRLCVFAIATTSWVTSLAVNLNPLMRFDGYYILSDSLGFQNLQNRGFEMARWRLREILFGLGEPAPELLSARTRRVIIWHAWATWVYRFFLFLGIAILVYAFFIKVIGIILFIVEIVWFILRPVAKEVAHWWAIREKIMSSFRFVISAGAIAGLCFLALLPWSTSITVPSVMVAANEQALYPPFPARIREIRVVEGQQVSRGQALFMLTAPQLDLQLKNALQRENLIAARIDRSGSDTQDRASLVVLSNELKEVREEIEGLRRLADRLIVRAPIDGVAADLDNELHQGMWVNTKTALGLVQKIGGARIKGYVAEQELLRFENGAQARFIPDNPELPVLPATVRQIAVAGAEALEEPYLALRHGGPIATEEGDTDSLRTKEAHYPVLIDPQLDATTLPDMAIRGITLVTGTPESLYTRIRRQVLKVFVRELGV